MCILLCLIIWASYIVAWNGNNDILSMCSVSGKVYNIIALYSILYGLQCISFVSASDKETIISIVSLLQVSFHIFRHSLSSPCFSSLV